jgi:outer membrane protein assembly factor BamA
MQNSRYLRQASLLAALLLLPFSASAKADHAQLKISGYGPLGDLELRHTLLLLEANGKRPPSFDADFIEDSVAILFSRLTDDGYLHPRITTEITLANGKIARYQWTNAFNQTLPRPLASRRLEILIERGTRFFYDDIRIDGLETLPLPIALSYFESTGELIRLKNERIYSPEHLRHGISSLTDALHNQGYNSARVLPQILQDNRTGAVRLRLVVTQGLQSFVRQVREEVFGPNTNKPPEVRLFYPDTPYSPLWQQDFSQSIKTNYYHNGFPDVSVAFRAAGSQTNQARVLVDLQASVRTGLQVRLGVVVFEGQKKTRLSVMQRQVKLKPGSLLDLTQVQQARYSLSELGVFSSVNLTLKPVDDHTRDALFDVQEAKRIEASLLFGYGTYELLRAGIELQQHNIFGIADSSQLRLSQSFKTSSAYYVYSIPDLLGPGVNLFFDAEALKRQELSFIREQYGGGLGVEKFFRPISTDLSLRYDFELLDAIQDFTDPADGLASALDGSFILSIKRDMRDNPLYPHHGYKIFATIEVANEDFGGQVNYERLEISADYHFPIGPGQWLHFGFDHGAVFTARGPALDLPFDKRFFPGGEDSIRGYLEGQAGSLNPAGDIVGAESMMLGSVEFEQELTTKLSAVAFLDTLGEARRIADYPFDQVLMSPGGGLSWRTLIGPIRLEYGYNLNRRPGDPIGTLQVSVGFPF